MSDGIAELVQEHVAAAPMADAATVETEQIRLADEQVAEQMDAGADPASLLDRFGQRFDQAAHVMEDGRPVMTADGRWRKRPGRKAAEPEPTVIQQEFNANGAHAAAVTTVEMVVGIMSGVLGDEWDAGDGERARMVAAWEGYYRAKGVNDMPPGIVVCATMAAYAGPRLTKPTTQSRLVTLYLWCRKQAAKLGALGMGLAVRAAG